MIVCEHIALSYSPLNEILRDVSVRLEQGSFHFLAGSSGAGKTSLLSVIALQRKPTRGNLSVFGKRVNQLQREELPFLRRKIGYVTQDFRLLGHLTVEENVSLPLKIAGDAPEQIKVKVAEILEWVGLKEHHKAYPDVLSGGQQQRVAIARAVINSPDILLADEPSGNLDKSLSTRFMYLFEALNKMGVTVLVATHDEYLIKKYSYPVLRLENGRLRKGINPEARMLEMAS